MNEQEDSKKKDIEKEELNKSAESKTESNQAESCETAGIPKTKPAPEESFFDKNKAIKVTIMLAIIIFACGYIRFYEASMPALDAAAKMDIIYITNEQVKERLYNPLANPRELQNEIDKTLKQIYREKEFKQAVEDRAKAYKNLYYDSSGYPYLVKADTYYYLRQARNILENEPFEKTLLPYIIAYIYTLSPYTLVEIAYYLPLIFAVLSCIIAFFLTAKISDYWGGFLAGFVLAIHPVFLDAVSLGNADTQIMNTFFSVLIAYLFISLLKSKKITPRLVYSGFLLISIHLFKLTWGNYYYIIFVLIVSLLAYFLLSQLRIKSNIKLVTIPGMIIAAFLLLLYVIVSNKFNRILSMLQIINEEAYYPNPINYIQELQGVSFSSFIARIDLLILLIAFVGAIYLIYSLIKKSDSTKMFILVWFISMFFVSFFAARLLMFFILPLSVLVGYGISNSYPYLLKFPKAIHIKIPQKLFEPMLAIIIIILISISIRAEIQEMTSGIPNQVMDDSIEKISKTILTKTESNAVVNDWWDLGHIYKYYTRRYVIADGATPDDLSVLWFAKALVSTNEKETVDILHMIDCRQSSNKEIKKVNCSVNEGVVIVSDYVIKRHPIILKTAEWDFKLAEIYNEIKNLPTSQAIEQIKQKYPEEDADEIYSHMTQYTDTMPDPKIQIPPQECTQKEETILCGQYSLDLNQRKMFEGINKEISFVYLNSEDEISKNIGSDKTIIVYLEGQRIRYARVDSDFMDSLLVKLYFFEAKGMNNFELLDKASFAYAKKIKAFTVRWDAIEKPLNNTIIN